MDLPSNLAVLQRQEGVGDIACSDENASSARLELEHREKLSTQKKRKHFHISCITLSARELEGEITCLSSGSRVVEEENFQGESTMA